MVVESEGPEYWRPYLPEGWRDLYDRLLKDLIGLGQPIVVDQAKEKFGELRVYLREYPEGATDLIDAATRKSRKTCQRCGAPGVLRATEDGFYATVCEQHGDQMKVAKLSVVRTFGTDRGLD